MARSFHVLDRLPPPFSLIDERVIFIPPGATLVTHNKLFKFIVVFEGEMKMEIRGGDTHFVEPGDVLVFPGPCVQEYIPSHTDRETRLHVARLLFDPHMTKRANRKGAQTSDPRSDVAQLLHRTFPQPVRLFGLMDGAVGARLRRVFREVEEGAPASRIAVHGELLLLLAEVIRHAANQQFNRKPLPASDRGAEIARQARAYLNENFDRDIHLSDIAWHLRLSEEHLARVFRQHTGETIAAVIRDLRIDKAKRQLLASNESMTAIAHSCGYGSLSVFSTNFKKATGLGPLAYRDLHTPKIAYPKSNIRRRTNRA